MPSDSTIAAGIILTAGAAALNFLAMGPAMIMLDIGLVAALLAWLATGAGTRKTHPLVGPVYLIAIAMLVLHAIEEYRGRLYETLPPRFGLAPFQPEQFIGFNLVWLAIFLTAAIGLFKSVRLSLLVVWFVALL
jgi:hypothetical protein